MKGIRIIFFGTSDFAVPALKSLLNFGYNVTAVVTQPEKPAGRLRIIMPSPVKRTALEHHIPVLEPHNLQKDGTFFEEFKSLNSDICVVAAYGKIIPIRYLEISKYGFLNIHPSLLPKYRGPSPIQTAIMNGDPAPILSAGRHSERGRDWCGASKETGVTIMKLDEQLDHGPILSSKPYYILPATYYIQAEQELAKLGAELLLDVLPKYLNGEIKPEEQDHPKATFTKLLTRHDGRIDWSRTVEEIYNQIRALNPEPGAWTIWKNKSLNIKSALPDCSKVPKVTTSQVVTFGTVLKINSNNVAVATKKCYLILKQIQLEGGKEMDAKIFINGHPDFLGSRLE